MTDEEKDKGSTVLIIHVLIWKKQEERSIVGRKRVAQAVRNINVRGSPGSDNSSIPESSFRYWASNGDTFSNIDTNDRTILQSACSNFFFLSSFLYYCHDPPLYYTLHSIFHRIFVLGYWIYKYKIIFRRNIKRGSALSFNVINITN